MNTQRISVGDYKMINRFGHCFWLVLLRALVAARGGSSGGEAGAAGAAGSGGGGRFGWQAGSAGSGGEAGSGGAQVWEVKAAVVAKLVAAAQGL